MGADQDSAGRRRPLRMSALLGCGVVLLAGCASMPDTGDTKAAKASQQTNDDTQVRVFAVPPRAGAQPIEIVKGFLEATTSDESDYRTAQKYLTAHAAKEWAPFSGTTVLSGDVPAQRAIRSGADRDSSTYTFSLTGKQVAAVDGKHAYKPEEAAYRETITLVKTKGKEWRIDTLPKGLVLGEADFQRIYGSFNKYYFPSLGTEMGKVGQTGLVADPVYLRKRIDPVTEAVKALLDGPTNWLDPVVDSKFPSGTKLAPGTKRLALDDSKALEIRLNDRGARAGQQPCERMAAQVLYTVQELASAQVDRVELENKHGGSLCVLGRSEAAGYAPGRGVGNDSQQQYFLDKEHRLVSLGEKSDEAQRVPGPFGTGASPLRSVGVARDEERAAGISTDGKSLSVGTIVSDGPGAEVKVRSHAKRAKDGLTAPSWDGYGDLWVADRDRDQPRLMRLEGGTGEPEQVDVPDLGDGRIEALRLAADGVRIALLVSRDGHTTLELGTVVREGTEEAPKLTVIQLHLVAPQLEDVGAVSWAGGSQLIVVGRESGGVQQVQYLGTDGSTSNAATVPGVDGVTAVAASEDDRQPLVAYAHEGIVRLPPGANWKTVVEEGSAPVYPG